MKKKIVLWGNDAEDKKILIALELQERENKVHLYTFQESQVSETFFNQMMDDWRNGKEVEFPEGYETIVRELSMTEDILPETIKVQRADLINRAKTEWHFVVLSTKLYDLYNTELDDFKEKVTKLLDFDGAIWDEMRSFWSKITEQARERNLFRDHADKLRDGANELFVAMKELKSKANEELAKVSKEHVGTFTTRLSTVKEKAEKGMSLGPLFDELKKIQAEFKNADFTRNDRSKVWKKIDDAFKVVKEKKYGKAPEGQNTALVRLERRYQGLKSAIGKMEASIRRDKSDIDYQNNRAGNSMGQLEMQLREAKVKMVEGRISSKQEKLDEMLSTKVDLEKRMEKEKARAEKQEEKKAIAKKKAEIKQKMDATISDQANLSKEEVEKLKKATSAVNEGKKKKTKAEDNKATATVSAKEEDKSAKAATETETTESKDPVAAKAEATIKESEELIESVKSDAKAPAQKADAVDDTIDKAKEVLSESEKAVGNKGDIATKATETAKEAVPEKKAASLADKAKSGGLLGAAMALGAKVVDKVSDTIEDVAENLGVDEHLDKAKEAVSKGKEALTEKMEDFSEATSETVQKVKDKASDLKEEATDAKEDKSAAVLNATGEKEGSSTGSTLMKGGLLGAAVALGAKMVDKVSDGIENVAESVGMEDTLEKAKSGLSDLKESVTESVDKVADRVRQEDPSGAAKAETVMGGSSEEE